MPSSTAPDGAPCISDIDDATARASAEFHAEVHSLASQLASAHRDPAQQWTDEEVEIIWLSHDAMERERDAALQECASVRAELAELRAERDALARLGSPATQMRAMPHLDEAHGRPRRHTLGLRSLIQETHGPTQKERDSRLLPERGFLDRAYLEVLDDCETGDLHDMVEECGAAEIVPAHLMQTREGLRGILCAYISGRPAATSNAVLGYLWKKDAIDSPDWTLHWAVLDCAANALGTSVEPVLKLCSSEEHETTIRQGNQPPDEIKASTADIVSMEIRLQECVEVRRSTVPLSKGGELELVSKSDTIRLCAATRGDSRVWARALGTVMRPNFGTTQEKFGQAARKQLAISQFVARLVSVRLEAKGGDCCLPLVANRPASMASSPPPALPSLEDLNPCPRSASTGVILGTNASIA